MYRALRPKGRHTKGSADGEQIISDELKRTWKQILPQFNNINSWTKLDGFDLAWILCVCPECVRQVPLTKLNSEDWHIPLQVNEGSLKPFWTACFGTSSETSRLLRADPSMIQYVDVLKRMQARHWWSVLDVHPDLAYATPESLFVDIPTKTWVQVLKGRPQSWVEVKAPWSDFSGSHWAELLLARPELATQCDWHKLREQDWNGILFTPATPPSFSLIHDVLGGSNLTCIMEHIELLKYLDWDTAPLLGLRELIVGSNLDIQPPSWKRLSARIVGEESFWQCSKSVRQFSPPSMPACSTSCADECFTKADLAEITECENKLALICFLGWELVYCASGGKMAEMNPALLVKYPGIGDKYGWENLPAEMHYEVVRMAPWLRNSYPWTEWPKGKLRRLFGTERAFMTEYREKHPFKYISVRFGFLKLAVALVACSIGAGGVYQLNVQYPLRNPVAMPLLGTTGIAVTNVVALVPSPGSLFVDCSEHGSVSLDGKTIGRSGEWIDGLSAGLHDLSVSASGYRRTSMNVRIEPGVRTRLAVKLQPEDGAIEINPAWKPAAKPTTVVDIQIVDAQNDQMPVPVVTPSHSLDLRQPVLNISAVVKSSDNVVPITGPAVLRIRRKSNSHDGDRSTNVALPSKFSVNESGTRWLTLTCSGFRDSREVSAMLSPDRITQLTFELEPLPSKLILVPENIASVVSVYVGTQYVGRSDAPIALPSMRRIVLMLHAAGKRQTNIVTTLPAGGTTTLPVVMGDVSSAIRISVTGQVGRAAVQGRLSVEKPKGTTVNIFVADESKPFGVSFPMPIIRNIRYEGAVRLSLECDGYQVLNSNQVVRLADSRTTNVVFVIEHKSGWLPRRRK